VRFSAVIPSRADGEGPRNCNFRFQKRAKRDLTGHAIICAEATDRPWGPSPSARLGMTNTRAP